MFKLVDDGRKEDREKAEYEEQHEQRRASTVKGSEKHREM
jgi:hypothetical protein